MRLIGLVSSAKAASAALMVDGTVVKEAFSLEQRRHSETLLPLLDEILTQSRMEPNEADAFAVDIGPGSFTGVRIGTASINALAHAFNKPVIGISALEILYEQAGCPEDALVLIDGGCGRAYGLRYENGAIANGPAAGMREDFIRSMVDGTVLIEGKDPTASALLLAAAKRLDQGQEAAYPAYLAPSQAERLYEQRKQEAGK